MGTYLCVQIDTGLETSSTYRCSLFLQVLLFDIYVEYIRGGSYVETCQGMNYVWHTLFNLHYHEVLCKDVNSFPFENMSEAES